MSKKKLTHNQKRKKKIDKDRRRKESWTDQCADRLIAESAKLAAENIAVAKAIAKAEETKPKIKSGDDDGE